MSEANGAQQKERVVRRRNKPEHKAGLRRTFAASRHGIVNSSGGESQQQDAGILQRRCACANHTIAGGSCTSCQKQTRATGLSGPNSKLASEQNESGAPSAVQAFPESRFVNDFSRTPVHTSAGSTHTASHSSSGVNPAQKSVQGQDDQSRKDEPAERDVIGKISREEEAEPAAAKKAGVESFEIKWSKNTVAGWGKARLRLVEKQTWFAGYPNGQFASL
jgi:hypothetical protein